MESWVLPALIACALSLVLSAVSFCWVIAFSSPASLRKYVDSSTALARVAMERADQLGAEFMQHKLETTALHESMDGMLDSVERKRRRISGAESRLNAGQNQAEPAPVTRDQIVTAARQKVYG